MKKIKIDELAFGILIFFVLTWIYYTISIILIDNYPTTFFLFVIVVIFLISYTFIGYNSKNHLSQNNKLIKKIFKNRIAKCSLSIVLFSALNGIYIMYDIKTMSVVSELACYFFDIPESAQEIARNVIIMTISIILSCLMISWFFIYIINKFITVLRKHQSNL